MKACRTSSRPGSGNGSVTALQTSQSFVEDPDCGWGALVFGGLQGAALIAQVIEIGGNGWRQDPCIQR